MANTIDDVYVQSYARNLRFLAQQSDTRLRGWCQEEHVSSEGHNFDILGAQEATKKTTRLQATPVQDYPWSRRKSIPVVYQTGDSTEQEDPTQMLQDPNSKLVKAQGMAMRRAYDDEIIAAAVGASRDGGGNAVAFDTVNQEVGDGSAPISFGLVTDVSERFMARDIDPDTQRVFVVSPRQARNMLQMTQATSGDYVYAKALADKGYVDNWMGYTWIVSTRLPDASVAQDGSEEYCFAMTRDAIGLQINKDIWARVAEDPSVSFAWRIYCAMQIGAVRVEDEQLVRVHLATDLV